MRQRRGAEDHGTASARTVDRDAAPGDDAASRFTVSRCNQTDRSDEARRKEIDRSSSLKTGAASAGFFALDFC
jgi:hypothetical protein